MNWPLCIEWVQSLFFISLSLPRLQGPQVMTWLCSGHKNNRVQHKCCKLSSEPQMEPREGGAMAELYLTEVN